MTDIYQPNSVFQPSQVVSTAPAYEAIRKAYMGSAFAASDLMKNIANKTYSTALENNKYEVSARAMKAINSSYMNSLKIVNPNLRAEYFQKSVEAAKQSILDSALDQNKEYAEKIFNNQYTSRMLDIQKDVVKHNRQVASYKAQDVTNTYANNALNLIRAGNFKDGSILLGQTNKIIDGSVGNGFITAKAGVALKLKTMKGAYLNAGIAAYEAAVKGGNGAEFLKAVAEHDPKIFGKDLDEAQKYFSPQDYDELTRQIQSLNKQKAVEEGLTGQALEQARKSIRFTARKTGKINTVQYTNVLNALPESSRSVFTQRVNNNIAIYKLVHHAINGSLPEINSAANLYSENATRAKDINENYIYKEAASELGEYKKLAHNDPVSFLHESSSYLSSLKSNMNNAGFNIYNFRLQHEIEKGLPRKPLLNSEAESFIGTLNQENPVEAATALHNFIYNNGKFNSNVVPYIKAQLFRYKQDGLKLSPKIKAADTIGVDNPYIGIISQAVSTPLQDYAPIKSKAVKISDISKQLMSNKDFNNLLNSFSQSPGDTSRQTSAFIETAKQLTAYLIAHDNMDLKDAADTAVDEITAGKTFHTHFNNGHTFYTPNDIWSITLPIKLSELRKTAIKNVDDFDLPNAMKNLRKKDVVSLLLSRSFWYNTNTIGNGGKGLALAYTDSAGNVIPLMQTIKTKSGDITEPIGVSFDQIKNESAIEDIAKKIGRTNVYYKLYEAVK